MRLDLYHQGTYCPRANIARQVTWYFFGHLLVSSRWIPWSSVKVWTLRVFGASIGTKVRIKPGLKVKFPWLLSVGDYSWLGENAWIDNLDSVRIGSHCCISQSAYLCTGDHSWAKESFDLITAPITLEDHSWVAAHSIVAPGTTLKEGAVLALGSVAKGTLNAWTIYQGNPAKAVRERPYTKPNTRTGPCRYTPTVDDGEMDLQDAGGTI
ncbi:MAG: WcaF family extracellular polysaccharide biosynthesis acetyltransferase [Bdellovibrionales bacterium]|nr:WcaF family extracellular polysaccharide biosynthesis acetyltransferase [Bdellovibrionales bacterium]